MRRVKVDYLPVSRDIAKALKLLKLTLGPHGKHVILGDNANLPTVTIDGFSVANRVKFENEASHAIWRIIREAGEVAAREVGDGTTTAMILAAEFYLQGYVAARSRRWVEIASVLNNTLALLESMPRNYKVRFDDLVACCARVSRDPFLGRICAQAICSAGSDGIVMARRSRTGTEGVEKTAKASYPVTCLVGREFSGKKALLLLVREMRSIDGFISAFHYASDLGYPLLVVARVITEDAKDQIQDIYTRTQDALNADPESRGMTPPLCVVLPDAPENAADAMFEDLAGISNSIVWDGYEKVCHETLGFVHGFVQERNKISVDVDTEQAFTYIQGLERQEAGENYRNATRARRAAKLRGKEYVVRIAAASEASLRDRLRRAEDGLQAGRALVNGGSVDGAGTEIARLARHFYEHPWMQRSLMSPLRTIAENASARPIEEIPDEGAYDAYEGKFLKAGPKDPYLVVCSAVSAAVSSAHVLLHGSETVLVD